MLKPARAPLGAVKLREEYKVVTGFPGDVPDELKQAREQQGDNAEFYRRADKAKLRKRNKQHQENLKKKMRAKAKQKKRQKRTSSSSE